MGATKNLFNEMRNQDFDVDMSGNLYQEHVSSEPQKLKVSVTNFGYFYKAELNGEPIDKRQLYKILKLKIGHSMSLEFHLSEFARRNKGYEVDVWDMDVS